MNRTAAFFRRLGILPFETAFGGLAAIAGTVGLFHVGTSTDALDAVLGHTLVAVFQVGYLLSGLAILAGLGTGRAGIEGFGLVLLFTSLIARLIAVFALSGLHVASLTLLALYALLTWACGVRLKSLFRREVMYQSKGASNA